MPIKRCVILCVCLVSGFLSAFSSDSVEVSSIFEDGHFVTRCNMKINAPDAAAHNMVDDFIRQDKYCLDSLFTWVLKGLKLQGEEGELLVYNLKSNVYDAGNDIIHGKMDVKAAGIYTIRDFSVDTRVTKKQLDDGQIEMYFEALDADAFIKTTTAALNIIRIDKNHAYCTLETKMSFGWFFNIFITQKRYKETAEWRFRQLMINLKETAEKSSFTVQKNE